MNVELSVVILHAIDIDPWLAPCSFRWTKLLLSLFGGTTPLVDWLILLTTGSGTLVAPLLFRIALALDTTPLTILLLELLLQPCPAVRTTAAGLPLNCMIQNELLLRTCCSCTQEALILLLEHVIESSGGCGLLLLLATAFVLHVSLRPPCSPPFRVLIVIVVVHVHDPIEHHPLRAKVLAPLCGWRTRSPHVSIISR